MTTPLLTAATPGVHTAGIEVHGLTRSAFLVRGALAAGAVYGTTMLAPWVQQTLASEHMGDVEILNFALTLELLETEFYRQGVQRAGLAADARTLAQEFGEHEAAHVEALTATIGDLGGTPAAKPTFTFPFKDQASFLKLAQTLEDTGVAAYNGAGPAIKSPDVLAAAGSIVQVEARHAAAIRLLIDEPPAPEAFDKAMTTDEVLAAVKPFIKA